VWSVSGVPFNVTVAGGNQRPSLAESRVMMNTVDSAATNADLLGFCYC
jgi:hypothetical protein